MSEKQAADVSRRIKQLRARLGVSQRGLATLLGVSALSVLRWEQGQAHPNPLAWRQFADIEAANAGETVRHLRPAATPPLQLTSFIGRESELVAICQRVTTARLVTLTGVGGCGKTRLALGVAGAFKSAYANGVWFVELAALVDPRLLPQTIATAVGVREEAGKPLLERLVSSLRDRQLLLVIDNCEHLLESCAALSDTLLKACPDVHILATSREALAVAGECIWPVSPLALPDPDRPQVADEPLACESVRLFVDRARGHQPGFALTSANVTAVEQVCLRLDGLPLAIELAAARIPLLSVEDIAARLNDCFRLLVGASRTEPPRHHTLRAAVDWSYDLLTESERTMFCRLGVFAGSFGLDAAETVACGPQVPRDDVLDLLGRLVAQSLVVAEKHHRIVRYRLLEILRAYARARLEERGELHATLVRHADYYVTLAERAEPELYSERQQSWLIELDAEHDNLRQALAWAVDAQQPTDIGVRLAGALARFWLNRGYLTEGRRWLIDVLARHTGAPAGCRAKALGGAGTLAEFQGDHQQAQALQEESLALWRELADKRGIAAALNNLGDVARQRGDYALARSRYEDSVTLAREARDAWRVASSLHQLADVARLLGDVESARQQFEECLELWRDLRDPQGLTAALTSLGELASFDGDAAAARDFLDQALDLARSLGNTWGTAWVLNTQAAVMRSQGEHAQAHVRLAESLALRQELGDRQGLVDGLRGSAVLAAASQQTQRAAQLLGAAESVAEDVGVSLAPVYRAEYEAAVGVARRALGEEAFAASFHLGRAMSVERAVSYAMQTEYSPRAKEVLNARVISSSHRPGETLNMSFATLSRRERQVAARIAQGFTNRQIASALVISERTAETYVTRILRKLGIDSRVQLAVWAAHSGFQSE